MTEAEKTERLEDIVREALLNIEGVQEDLSRVRRRLDEQMEALAYEASLSSD
jgi:hypothetical protein